MKINIQKGFKTLALFLQRKFRGLDSAYANQVYSDLITVREAGITPPLFSADNNLISTNTSPDPCAIGNRVDPNILPGIINSLAEQIRKEEQIKQPKSWVKRFSSWLATSPP